MPLGSHTISKSLSILWMVDRKLGEVRQEMVVNLVAVRLIQARLTREASLREVKVDQILKQSKTTVDHLLSLLLKME